MFIFRPVATREIRKSLCFNPRLLLFAPLLISLASSPVFSQDCWQLYTYCSQYGGQYCTDFQNLCQPFWPYDYCGCMAARHDEYFCHQFCAYTVCTCVELCPVQSVDVSGPASLIIGGEDGMYQAMPSPGFGSGFWEWSLSNPFAGSLSPAFSSPTFYPIAPPSATLVEATFHPSDAYCPDVTGWTPVVTDCPAYSVSIDGPPAAVAGGNDETFSASVLIRRYPGYSSGRSRTLRPGVSPPTAVSARSARATRDNNKHPSHFLTSVGSPNGASSALTVIKLEIQAGGNVLSEDNFDSDKCYISTTPAMPQITARLRPGQSTWRCSVEPFGAVSSAQQKR